jgi:geranylgeranyl diphosphate synthase type I
MNTEKRIEKPTRFVEIFKKKSEKGLEFARKAIFSEKIESEKAREALDYYTSNWEIFIHPGLFSTACEAVGGNPDNAVPFQAALSMLTASFDLHDDVIDGSTIKQGKPTVLGKFGKSMAVLLGDAFLIGSFTLLLELSGKTSQDKMKKVVKALREFLFTLGSAHVLEQSLKGRTDITLEEYTKVLELKASSVEADMRLGAIIGGGSSEEVEILAKYGKKLGMLMTLREEFIDVLEPKELHQRIKNEYLPMPILCAFQNLTVKETVQSILSQKYLTNMDFEKICKMTLQTSEVKQLKNYMKEAMNEAVSSVSALRKSSACTLLKKLAHAMLEEL